MITPFGATLRALSERNNPLIVLFLSLCPADSPKDVPTPSATSSAPRLSIATPTGRPQASPSGPVGLQRLLKRRADLGSGLLDADAEGADVLAIFVVFL